MSESYAQEKYYMFCQGEDWGKVIASCSRCMNMYPGLISIFRKLAVRMTGVSSLAVEMTGLSSLALGMTWVSSHKSIQITSLFGFNGILTNTKMGKKPVLRASQFHG